MRVAIVSREVIPFFGAGIGTYAAAMARAWMGAGHELHIVSDAHPEFVERGPGLLGGATCHAVTPDLVPDCAPDSFAFMRHALGVYRLLRRLHEQTPFDAIEFPDYWAEGYFAIRAKRTLGAFESAVLGVRLHTPTHDCRALNDETWLDEETATLEHCEEAAIREADVVISPSLSLLAMLTERLTLVNPRCVVPYPFEPLARIEAPPTPRPTVLYYGRLERRKGVELLMQVVQELLSSGMDIDARFIGGDTLTGPSGISMRAHLESMLDPKWRDRITLQASVPRSQLAPIISSVESGGGLACFPSVWENFPNACLEAMSLGCPVVGSDAGGMSEIIEGGGLVFKSGDAISLRAALVRILSEPQLRTAAASAGPVRVACMTEPALAVERMIAAIKSTAPAPTVPASTHESPAVSIIIPFYNLSQSLPETLESVRKQTFPDFEVIVVDDGSTEPAASVLLERVECGEFGPIRLIRKPHGGLAAARNTGVTEARGRWIVPLDAGDLLEPEFLQRALGAVARDPDLKVVTALVHYIQNEQGLPDRLEFPIGLDRDLLATHNCASSCTALIDRQLLLDLGGYDASLRSFDDWDLYCRMALRAVRMTVIPEPLIRCRQRTASAQRRVGERSREQFFAQVAAKYPGLPEHPDRSLRIILARGAAHNNVENRVRAIIDGNIRYRLADQVNVALKRSGVHGAVKGLASRVFGNRGKDEP